MGLPPSDGGAGEEGASAIGGVASTEDDLVSLFFSAFQCTTLATSKGFNNTCLVSHIIRELLDAFLELFVFTGMGPYATKVVFSMKQQRRRVSIPRRAESA